MIPRRVIHERKQSAPATCTHVMANGTLCRVAMRLEIKEPKVWSYQMRISERCLVGHIAHGQGVLDHDPPSTLNYERDDDNSSWGV